MFWSAFSKTAVLTELLFIMIMLHPGEFNPRSFPACSSYVYVPPFSYKSKLLLEQWDILPPLIRKCLPLVLAMLQGFSHATAVCYRIQDRGGLCHHMDTTPMDIKRTSRHALDQNHHKDTSNTVIEEVTFRTLPGLFSLPAGVSIGWVFRKYPFHGKFLQVLH